MGIVWSPVLLVLIAYEIETSLISHKECIHINL